MVAAGLVLGARASLASHYRVPSGSMEPTIETGDRLLVDKRAYGLRIPLTQCYLVEFDGPARGDVVVFDSPADGALLVKRVVGLPGDRVAVRAGRVFINGVHQPIRIDAQGQAFERLGGREHRVRLTRDGGPDYGPLTLPQRHYLMLGDNRGDSLDGRFFGPVRRRAILGRVVGIFWRRGRPFWQRL